jgi:uncharacterized protein (DUF4415 family)
MSVKSTKRKSPRSRTDWGRLQAMNDREIDYSEIPETDERFWAGADVVMPPAKIHLSLRLDEDVVNWFKQQGPGYQTRINAVLRSYIRIRSSKDGAARATPSAPGHQAKK